MGKGTSFDGAGRYCSINSSASLDIADNLSISIWVHPTAEYIGYAIHPINKWSGLSNANYVLYYFGTTSGSFSQNIAFYANAGGTWKGISSFYQLPLNNWTHVGFSYTSDQGGQLYINGAPYGKRAG